MSAIPTQPSQAYREAVALELLNQRRNEWGGKSFEALLDRDRINWLERADVAIAAVQAANAAGES